MTLRQLAVVFATTLLATALAAAIGLLGARAALVALEGNDLRAPDSIAIRTTLADLRAAATTLGPDTRAFVALSDDDRVRSVVALGGGAVDLPVHSGRSFTSDDGQEALVGDASPVQMTDGERHLRVDGRRYDVVGRLGLRGDSLVAEDVLVNDPDLFADEAQRIVLSGRDIASRFATAFPDEPLERLDTGTNRRTNVDIVTPLMTAVGVVLAVLVSVFAGLLAAASERPRARTAVVVGRAPFAVVLLATVRTATIAAAAGAVTSLLGALFAQPLHVAAPPVERAVVLGAVATAACCTAMLVRRNAWS